VLASFFFPFSLPSPRCEWNYSFAFLPLFLGRICAQTVFRFLSPLLVCWGLSEGWFPIASVLSSSTNDDLAGNGPHFGVCEGPRLLRPFHFSPPSSFLVQVFFVGTIIGVLASPLLPEQRICAVRRCLRAFLVFLFSLPLALCTSGSRTQYSPLSLFTALVMIKAVKTVYVPPPFPSSCPFRDTREIVNGRLLPLGFGSLNPVAFSHLPSFFPSPGGQAVVAN